MCAPVRLTTRRPLGRCVVVLSEGERSDSGAKRTDIAPTFSAPTQQGRSDNDAKCTDFVPDCPPFSGESYAVAVCRTDTIKRARRAGVLNL